MRKKIVHISLLTIAIVVAALVIISWKSADYNDTCEETMEECCQKKKSGGPDSMIWETLPGQFFSSYGLN